MIPALQRFPGCAVVTADDDVDSWPTWLEELMEAPLYDASPLTFPTGVSGVLYRPGLLDDAVTAARLFRRLRPEADDIWLYWMLRLRGGVARRIRGGYRLHHWPGTQDHGPFPPQQR